MPLVAMVKEIGSRHALQVVPVGEAMLSDLQVRPDYAVQVDGAICGYIEIKKPELGADAPALTGKHTAPRRRPVVYPTQSGGIGGIFLGLMPNLAPKG
ncbi:MAG: hypothetical protein ACRDRI_22905 [Pseudonocardiaceae bacterium]